MHNIDHEFDTALVPLTADLSSSLVDPSNLITDFKINVKPIGMGNFKSKKIKTTSPILPRPINQSSEEKSPNAFARQRWKAAAKKIKLIKDPWYAY